MEKCDDENNKLLCNRRCGSETDTCHLTDIRNLRGPWTHPSLYDRKETRMKTLHPSTNRLLSVRRSTHWLKSLGFLLSVGPIAMKTQGPRFVSIIPPIVKSFDTCHRAPEPTFSLYRFMEQSYRGTVIRGTTLTPGALVRYQCVFKTTGLLLGSGRSVSA